MRKAIFSDLDKIKEIVNDAKKSLKDDGVDQWQRGVPDMASLARQISRDSAYVYELDENIMAYAYLSNDYEPTYASVANDMKRNNPYTIHTFCVNKNTKELGVATNFMKDIIKKAREDGKDSLRIDTHEDNFKMRGLIEKMDFEFRGVIYIRDFDITAQRLAYELVL